MLSSSHAVRWLVLVGVLVLLAGGAWAGWFFLLRTGAATPTSVRGPDPDTTPPPDPRVTFATDFQNVKPGVQYVGDAACRPCHKDQCDGYHNHPMGKSAAVAGQAEPLEKYDAAGKNPFTTPAHKLSVTADGKKHAVSGADPATAGVPAYEVPVDVVIGSGTRGRSYLTLDRGAVWQSPVSWFTRDGRWNVSPGFDLSDGGRRGVRGECLFCHVNRTEPVPRSENLYKQVLVGQAAIGCERCHGPAELHVAKQTDGAKRTGRDTTIVNPKHLPQQLQMDVCRQCHLLGEQRVTRRGRELDEFRPGLPFDQFVSVYVRHPDLADTRRSVGQFEQIEKSECFARSKAMTCTSCHDPHFSPAEEDKHDPPLSPPKEDKPTFFRTKCMTCHEKRGCAEKEPVRQAKGNDCVACHMPKRGSTSVAHAAVTDHTIPRRADASSTTHRGGQLLPGMTPIVAYRVGQNAPSAEERDRDLGVALAVQLTNLSGGDPAVAQSVAKAAVAKLTAAVGRWPTDDIAWLRLSNAYGVLGEAKKCVEAARKAAELQPESEWALATLAEAEMASGDSARAIEVWEKLIKLNPSAVSYRLLRASALRVRQEWAKAEQGYRDALAIDPMVAEAHLFLAVVLDKQGKADEAKKEADAAFALETNAEALKLYRQVWAKK